MDSEKAALAKVGDNVILRLSNADEINAEIVYVKEEKNNTILVFKIEENVSELLTYRKISFDVIWWKYTGWKISNSCIVEEKGQTYVESNIAGFVEKIPIKVLRQNDTYSIVENYTEKELEELGYTEYEIDKMDKIKLYDEIILH